MADKKKFAYFTIKSIDHGFLGLGTRAIIGIRTKEEDGTINEDYSDFVVDGFGATYQYAEKLEEFKKQGYEIIEKIS